MQMMIYAVQSFGRFIKTSEAKVHDKNFIKSLELISHSMNVLTLHLIITTNLYFVNKNRGRSV